MRGRVPSWIFLCGLLTLAPMLGGCAAGRHMMYVMFGGGEKDVKAEFTGLEGKTVAVVVYSDRRTQYEYVDVNLTLSSAIAGQLEKNVKRIKVIPPQRIVRYQDENIYWDELEKTELGKAFGADFVLFVPLEEFGTRMPDSSYLYRGRITCDASVFDVSKPSRDAVVYKTDKIRVLYPEHEPAGLMSEGDRVIRARTEALFAKELAYKFYDHKVPVK